MLKKNNRTDKGSIIKQTYLGKRKSEWTSGSVNKIFKDYQEIRITEGCPNQCPFCYEPKKIKIFGLPRIVRNKVKILDMNLICKEEASKIMYQFGDDRVNGMPIEYELVCGIDYRFLTPEIAETLMVCRFVKPRLAWDFDFKEQYKIKDAIEMLLNVGYKRKDILVFMIVNWLTKYETNLKKLDLCKVWNVKVGDCPYDGMTWNKIVPVHWTMKELKDFRKKVRKHNQLVNFGIDPEVKA